VTFEELITPKGGGTRLAIEIPDGWQQGLGAFGGMVLAILARAAETQVEPARVLRALNGELVGPARPGEAEILLETLREGSGVTAVAARMIQQGACVAFAVCSFGKDRGTYARRATPPPMPDWRAMAVTSIGPPVAPVFTQHVEYRVEGALPFTGGGGVETSGWTRLRAPGRARDAAFAIAMIDTWWPAFLAAEPAPRPAATLTFAFERLAGLDGLDPDAPLFYRGRVLGGADGFAVEARELWGEDGRLVALNQQTFVIIK
jgi:hypothetical protein